MQAPAHADPRSKAVGGSVFSGAGLFGVTTAIVLVLKVLVIAVPVLDILKTIEVAIVVPKAAAAPQGHGGGG